MEGCLYYEHNRCRWTVYLQLQDAELKTNHPLIVHGYVPTPNLSESSG